MFQKIAIAAAGLTLATTAFAKLPPLDDAAKAKAAETAARAAWQAKVDAFQLCKAQDNVAAKYRKSQGGAAAVKTSAPAQQPSAQQPAAQQAAAPQAAAPQAAASGTPTPATAAAVAPPPCADPGPFAYNPPEQKPLEASGAHSPTGTAASPPSVRPEAATMSPGKGGVPAAPSTPAAPAAAAPAKKS
jgi:hypothetical protein